MSVRHRFVDGPGGWFLTLGLAVGLVLALMRPASAAEMEGKWYDSFWPLGDRVDVHTLSEEYIPFKSVGEIPCFTELSVPREISGEDPRAEPAWKPPAGPLVLFSIAQRSPHPVPVFR